MRQILVVEDDASIRGLVSEVLRDDGYEVSEASNGVEALEAVGERRPDLIVLDLMMPVMDGWAFLDACQREELCKGTPVLVVSAYRALPETAPQLGVRGCIAKPFDLDVVLGAVERLVQRAA